jgi:hypothetical protein
LAQLFSRFTTFKLLKAVALSVVAAVLTAFVAIVASYLFFPVTGVEVSGSRMFPESVVWEAVPNHASLLFLNAASLEKEIESNPWVKGATVLKDWDSGIVTVEVEEREAALNGDLDGRRVVLAGDGTELPGLGGADIERVKLDETRLEDILRVIKALQENGVELVSVDGADEGGFEATVEGRRVLFAGDVDQGQSRALVDFMEEHPEAAYFDLRSPERIVVGAESGG